MTQETNETAPAAAAPDPWRADFDLGRTHLEKGELSLAAAAFHNAMIVCQETADEKGLANAVHMLGETCFRREDYAVAAGHLQRARDICQRQEDMSSVFALDRKLILVWWRGGDLVRAVAASLVLLDVYQNCNNPQGAVQILEQLSRIYLDQGERRRAVDALKTAASIHAGFGHQRHAAALEDEAAKLAAS